MTGHVMVDIETMGTRPGSIVLSIGAVEFDPKCCFLGEQFYAAIDPGTAEYFGLTMDLGTMLWWMDQSEAARQVFWDRERLPIGIALPCFAGFLARLKTESGLRLWAHGPQFDVVLLERAFAAIQTAPPWKYNEGRDTRTLYEAADFDPSTIPFMGTTHNALDDAKHQAKCVQAAYRKLRQPRLEFVQ